MSGILRRGPIGRRFFKQDKDSTDTVIIPHYSGPPEPWQTWPPHGHDLELKFHQDDKYISVSNPKDESHYVPTIIYYDQIPLLVAELRNRHLI